MPRNGKSPFQSVVVYFIPPFPLIDFGLDILDRAQYDVALSALVIFFQFPYERNVLRFDTCIDVG